MTEIIKPVHDWWYVLCVKSNTEKRVVNEMSQYIKTLLVPYKVEPFVLESEQYYRNKRYQKLGNKYQRRPLFPGYVFIETNMPDIEFMKAFYEYISRSSCILKILRSRNDNKFAISDQERMRLEYWCLNRRCLSHSQGYIESDQIVIISGPLIGREGIIKRINRHNRCAEIELNFLDQKKLVKVALEITEKL